MSVRQLAVIVLLVVVGAGAVAAPAAGATDSYATQGPVTFATNQTNGTDAPGNGTTGVGFGTQISAFMQASSADTNGSVDSGMWQARFNASNDSRKTRVVTHRIDKLDRRLTRLEAELSTLEATHENGTRDVAYMARASRLTAKIDSLQRAINDTDDAATSVGVNTTRLDRLRTHARNMSGRDVAMVARGLGVVSPPGLDNHGPPTDAGRQGEAGPPTDHGPGVSQQANGTAGPGANASEHPAGKPTDHPGANGQTAGNGTGSQAAGHTQAGASDSTKGGSGNPSGEGGTRASGTHSGSGTNAASGSTSSGGSSGGSTGGNSGGSSGGNSGGSSGGNRGGGASHGR